MKNPINRRRFLTGAGVCIALPAFHSLLPKGATAAESSAKRLVVLYHPNGTTQDTDELEIPTGLKERLSDFDDQMSVVYNLNNGGLKNRQYRVLAHPHMDCFLPLYTGGVIPAIGQENPSFDQIIASNISEGTQFSSLSACAYAKEDSQLGVPPHYFNTISWKGPGQPVDPFTNPRSMFERLFANVEAVDNADALAQLNRRRQYLDAVVGEIRDLKGKLSADDKVRLDQYLSGIEDLDRRTRELVESGGTGPICDPSEPASVGGSDEGYAERLEAFHDLAIKALQCDMTRVFTMMHAGVAGGGGVLNLPFAADFEGAVKGWHPLSHWKSPYGNLSTDTALNRRDLLRVTQWHYDRTADFLGKLRDTQAPSGASLLDETLVTWGSSMGYGAHYAHGVYQVLIGGGDSFKKQQNIDAGEAPSGVLWNSVLDGFGIEGQVGESDERIPDILV